MIVQYKRYDFENMFDRFSTLYMNGLKQSGRKQWIQIIC